MNKLVEAIKEQIKQEIGEDVEINRAEEEMLLQKYGLMASKLTTSEKHLIMKEERRNGI